MQSTSICRTSSHHASPPKLHSTRRHVLAAKATCTHLCEPSSRAGRVVAAPRRTWWPWCVNGSGIEAVCTELRGARQQECSSQHLRCICVGPLRANAPSQHMEMQVSRAQLCVLFYSRQTRPSAIIKAFLQRRRTQCNPFRPPPRKANHSATPTSWQQTASAQGLPQSSPA